VAGPNGSGKTTFLKRGSLHAIISGLPPQSLSSDVVTATLVQAGVETTTANLGAANLIDDMLKKTVDQGRSVIVETVLSSDKYLKLVQNAKQAGTRIGLIFVTLQDDVDHSQRVKQRVEQGGHDVPVDKIAARRTKSHANLFVFSEYTEVTIVFDNSNLGDPVLVAERKNSTWILHDINSAPADIRQKLMAISIAADSPPP